MKVTIRDESNQFPVEASAESPNVDTFTDCVKLFQAAARGFGYAGETVDELAPDLPGTTLEEAVGIKTKRVRVTDLDEVA